MIKIQVLNASQCRVLRNEDHWDYIYKMLSHTYKTKLEAYEGKLVTATKSYFSRQGGKFGLGLLPYVISKMEQDGVNYDLDCPMVPNIPNRIKDVKIKGIVFEDYQEKVLNFFNNNYSGVIKAPTGCLIGDTNIPVNRAKKGFSISLYNLHKRFHGIQKHGRSWDTNIPTFVRSFNDSQIILHEIEDVVFSGIKPVWKLILENGYYIIGTKNHPIMTNKGFVPLLHLFSKDYAVMIDPIYPSKSYTKKKKQWDKMITNLWFHPYAQKVETNKMARGWTKRIELHRAIYEAELNHISLAEYIWILRKDEIASKSLKFINPSEYHIHHKNGDHFDNDPKNLIHKKKEKHLQSHAFNADLNFKGTIPQFSFPVSIEYVGKKPTYDIICKEPYHNFSANQIIVHNSGKTFITLGLIKKFGNPKTLITTPRENIARKTTSELQNYGFDVGLICGKEQSAKPIIVAVWNSVQNLMKQGFDFNEYFKGGLVIVDECHLAKEAIANILKSLPDVWVRIGLSATPIPRAQKADWFRITSQLGPIVTQVSESEAEERITDVEAYMFENVNHTNNKYYQDIYVQDFLLHPTRNKLITDMIEYALITKKKDNVLILVDETRQAMAIAAKMKANKKLPQPVIAHAGLGGDILEKIIKRMNKYQIPVLISTPVFGVGTDIPNIEAVIVASGRKNLSNLIQKIGRGRRKTKYKEILLVLDIYDDFGEEDRYFWKYSDKRKKYYKRMGWLKEMIRG
jgi:superfamily II DNA or RNA helicase